jgi:hypothetical protein
MLMQWLSMWAKPKVHFETTFRQWTSNEERWCEPTHKWFKGWLRGHIHTAAILSQVFMRAGQHFVAIYDPCTVLPWYLMICRSTSCCWVQGLVTWSYLKEAMDPDIWQWQKSILSWAQGLMTWSYLKEDTTPYQCQWHRPILPWVKGMCGIISLNPHMSSWNLENNI